MKTFLIRLAAFLCFLFVVLEVVFRTALPAARIPPVIQRDDYPILVMDRSRAESGEHTIGRYCRPSFHWRVNNEGFNSVIDFLPPDQRELPCAVVVGNSYAHGLYSDVDETLAARIGQGLEGHMLVYNMGMSGMPLSQVPEVVRYAVERFAPEVVIVQTSLRSLPGSLRGSSPKPYNRQYAVVDGSLAEVEPDRFEPNPYKHLVYESAIVRYLLFNANYSPWGAAPEQDADQDRADRPAPSVRVPDLGPVAQRVIAEIVAAADGAEVLLVHDADRRAISTAQTKPPRLADSALLEAACLAHGAEFLDLTQRFWDTFAEQGRSFNFEDNYHWNPYGVSVVAGAVLDRLKRLGIPAE